MLHCFVFHFQFELDFANCIMTIILPSSDDLLAEADTPPGKTNREMNDSLFEVLMQSLRTALALQDDFLFSSNSGLEKTATPQERTGWAFSQVSGRNCRLHNDYSAIGFAGPFDETKGSERGHEDYVKLSQSVLVFSEMLVDFMQGMRASWRYCKTLFDDLDMDVRRYNGTASVMIRLIGIYKTPADAIIKSETQ